MTISLVSILLSAGMTLIFCSLLYRILLAKSVLDIPNARSSHIKPTPKGGGLGVILTICVVTIGSTHHSGSVLTLPLIALALSVLILSTISFIDDLKGLGILIRIVTQTALSLVTTGLIFWSFGVEPTLWVSLSVLISLVFLVWMINLYNFMDGIDGIAALQGILAGLLIYFLDLANVYPGQLGYASLVIAISCTVFMVYNFPPAKMFMGDAGSTALGLLFGGIALLELFQHQNAFWIWIISLAGFICDATVTLLVRLFTGHQVFEAHRSHLYQLYTIIIEANQAVSNPNIETARYLAHRKYLLIFSAIFIFWQVPCALLVATQRLSGFTGAALCISLMALGIFICGAGRVKLYFPRD